MKCSKADAADYIRRTCEMTFDKAMEVAAVYDSDVFRKGWPVKLVYEEVGNAVSKITVSKITSCSPFVTMKDGKPSITLPDGTTNPYIPTDEDREAEDWHYYTVEICD